MKFDYAVKHNGVYYPAGTDVPVGGNTPKVTEKAEPVKEEVKEEPKPQPKKKK